MSIWGCQSEQHENVFTSFLKQLLSSTATDICVNLRLTTSTNYTRHMKTSMSSLICLVVVFVFIRVGKHVLCTTRPVHARGSETINSNFRCSGIKWYLNMACFFLCNGGNNNINVLDWSPIFNDIYLRKSYDVSFQVNGASYKHGYHLTDVIYPELASFVKSFSYRNYKKQLKFKASQ